MFQLAFHQNMGISVFPVFAAHFLEISTRKPFTLYLISPAEDLVFFVGAVNLGQSKDMRPNHK